MRLVLKQNDIALVHKVQSNANGATEGRRENTLTTVHSNAHRKWRVPFGYEVSGRSKNDDCNTISICLCASFMNGIHTLYIITKGNIPCNRVFFSGCSHSWTRLSSNGKIISWQYCRWHIVDWCGYFVQHWRMKGGHKTELASWRLCACWISFTCSINIIGYSFWLWHLC